MGMLKDTDTGVHWYRARHEDWGVVPAVLKTWLLWFREREDRSAVMLKEIRV